MKSVAANILLVIALCISVVTYYLKHHKHTAVNDHIKTAVAPLRQLLSNDSEVLLKNSASIEMSFLVINTLAPRRVSPENHHADTTLYILPIENHNHFESAAETVVWQFTDEQYHYILTAQQR